MVLNHKKFNQIIKELIFKYLIVKNVKILKKSYYNSNFSTVVWSTQNHQLKIKKSLLNSYSP
jgi:glycine/serine hydroxymethyltransferase